MDKQEYMVIFQYDEVKHTFYKFDHDGRHILIKLPSGKYSENEFINFIEKFKKAEVSIFVDHKAIPDFVYAYCIQNRIVLYSEIENNCIWSNYRLCERVVLGSFEQFTKLTTQELKFITDNEVNVCLINPYGNIQDINVIYSMLLKLGFCKLFSIVSTLDREKYYGENIGLIGRKMIEQFNIHNNFQVREQIDQIKKNTLHRYNRMQSLKTNRHNVILVNLNVAPNNESRKNLGIEYLASVLNQNGYSTMCLYSNRFAFIQDIELILKEQPNIKVIGFSCMEDNLSSVEKAIDYLKNHYSHIITTIGGAQAVALNESFIRNSPVDYIMVGESEHSYLDLIKNIFESNPNFNTIKNLRFINQKNEYVETPRGDLIKDLDSIPFPDYVYHKDDNLSVAGIITGRGCPYNCAFCYEGAKEKTVRYRSLQNVFEEISLLVKNKANLKRIQFYDDTFTVDINRVREFCERYSEVYEKYKIGWACEIHCQTVYKYPNLLADMVQSGLFSAQIGLESGNISTLKKLNKKTTPEQILQTIRICKSAGLSRLEGNIMLGATEETSAQLEEQFDFAEKLITAGRGMFELGLVMFWPFFNTPISLDPPKYGIKILDKQCKNTVNCIHNFVTESKLVSREEYVEHYYKLVDRISKIYEREVLNMKANEVIFYWKNHGINLYSQWGRALSKYKYIQNFIFAETKMSTDFSNINVCPVRTFNLLTYKNGCLYLKESMRRFGKTDSAILELCNGKNTVRQIADSLKYQIAFVQKKLTDLKEQMYIYGVSL